jgi:ubiquinone/menaquinone biosynthesis C-methylase UbiE
MSTDAPAGNTYVYDPESPVEMTRLIILDTITTRAMGGPLTGIPQTADMYDILDLACGPGGWVLDVAFTFPHIDVAGIDISRTMVDYANARARSQGLANASFGTMDITQPLDFAENTFDLVNARFLVVALQRESWEPLIAECLRVLRPGGILRLTESVDIGVTNSQAFQELQAMAYHLVWQGGYGFSVNGKTFDSTHLLPRLLRKAGYQEVQYAAHALEFSRDTPAWADFYRNNEIAYRSQSSKISTSPDTQKEVEQWYQRMLAEMNLEEFCGMWHWMTIWGKKPS